MTSEQLWGGWSIGRKIVGPGGVSGEAEPRAVATQAEHRYSRTIAIYGVSLYTTETWSCLFEVLCHGSPSQKPANRTSVNFPQGQSSELVGWCFHAPSAVTDLLNGNYCGSVPMFWTIAVIIYLHQAVLVHKSFAEITQECILNKRKWQNLSFSRKSWCFTAQNKLSQKFDTDCLLTSFLHF